VSIVDLVQVTLEISETEAETLASKFGDLSLAAKGGLAARAYEQEIFSLEQVRRFMGFDNRWDAQDLLSQHGVWPGYTLEDLENDRETMASFRKLEAARATD